MLIETSLPGTSERHLKLKTWKGVRVEFMATPLMNQKKRGTKANMMKVGRLKKPKAQIIEIGRKCLKLWPGENWKWKPVKILCWSISSSAIGDIWAFKWTVEEASSGSTSAVSIGSFTLAKFLGEKHQRYHHAILPSLLPDRQCTCLGHLSNAIKNWNDPISFAPSKTSKMAKASTVTCRCGWPYCTNLHQRKLDLIACCTQPSRFISVFCGYHSWWNNSF